MSVIQVENLVKTFRTTQKEPGVVFGQRTQLWWDLALIESLDLVAKLYEIALAYRLWVFGLRHYASTGS